MTLGPVAQGFILLGAYKLVPVGGERLEQLAELAVRFGANVQPGQIVVVGCEPGKEPLTRAIAAEAYRLGARFVDVQWFDPWVKRARIADGLGLTDCQVELIEGDVLIKGRLAVGQ